MNPNYESFQDMLQLAENLKTESERVLHLNLTIADATKTMKDIEAACRAIVTAQLEPNGKPTYSNEDKRKAAIAEMLEVHGEYKDAAEMLDNATNSKNHAYIELEYARNIFAAHNAILISGGRNE